MPKFRKKPVVIEAVQFDGISQPINDFIGARSYKDLCSVGLDSKGRISEIIINTLEGKMLVNKGDWIIKGVKGEFYPCKPDIFEMTYELVEETVNV